MASSFPKLEEAYNHLNWIKGENITKSEINATANYVQQLIQETIIDHQPKPSKKEFNIWDYVDDNEMRPVLNGVYHNPDRKTAVATDAHILVEDSESFNIELVDTKDEDGYQRKRPNEYEKFTIDINEIAALCTKFKTWCKLEKYALKYARNIMCVYKIQNTYFKIQNLYKFLKATNGEVNIKAHNQAAIYISETRRALIMPVLVEPKQLQHIDGMLILDVN